MSVNGVEIKVGQKWKTRNGKLAEVIAGPDSGVTYIWCVEMLPSGPKWTANENGEQLHDNKGPWDLQFLVEDPEVALTQPAARMVEEIKLTPHPLRRAADWPNVAAAVDETAGLSPDLKPGDGVYDPAPTEPQFENSLPGALLGPDEALRNLEVKEGDPRSQQTADSPKRRAVDDPVVAAIERLQSNQDDQGRTPFMRAVDLGQAVNEAVAKLADTVKVTFKEPLTPSDVRGEPPFMQAVESGQAYVDPRHPMTIKPTPEQARTLRDLMDEGFKQLSEFGPLEVRESSVPVGVETLAEMRPGHIEWVKREVPADPTRTDEFEVNFRGATDDTPQSALDRQIGGGHYKQFAIQPVEFIHKNGIGFIEGNCIKYLARWREKGGIQDLEKVKHYLDLLIELERGES